MRAFVFLLSLVVATTASVYARDDQDAKFLLHQNKVSQVLLAKANQTQPQELPEFPKDCDPFPIPTVPEGPTVTFDFSDFGDHYTVTAWRYPCNVDFSWVMFTIEPEMGQNSKTTAITRY